MYSCSVIMQVWQIDRPTAKLKIKPIIVIIRTLSTDTLRPLHFAVLVVLLSYLVCHCCLSLDLCVYQCCAEEVAS